MKRIKQLEENLINQIAAGEVIERPASVVKELVENAVDAGATKISVEINNECRNIRVADNGSGIHKEDIPLAFSRHATSKISQQNDLWNISTLGFRGEALASIISVSKVTCTTRTSESSVGYKAECENSKVNITKTGCAQGTIIEIKDLFYNTPVRLKFLKKAQTEFAYILEIMQSIAISHPEVAFTLMHKDRTSLKTTGSKDIETVISEVYAKELINELTIIDKEDPASSMQAYGVASTPEYTRSNKKAIYTFINGRTVKSPVIQKAIDMAYSDLIPSGRYPFVIISLTIKPDEVDVNVHPSKKDIRFTNTNLVYSFVHSSVKQALEKSFSQVKPIKEQQPTFSNKQANPILEEESSFIPVQEKTDFAIFNKAPTVTIQEETVEQTTLRISTLQTDEEAKKFNIIGQFRNTYILIDSENGLQVIDQHIAHERYLYEQLLEKKEKNEQIASQLLFTSNVIELEPSDISLVEENQNRLEMLGYKFEFLSEKEVIFRQIPQLIAGKQPEAVIGELLEALKGNLEDIDNQILITTSCKAAIKAGEKLSIWQMEELLRQWSSTKHPQTCPHGRPISHTIPEKEVAKFFGRSV